jgi:1,4-alpha-glucan branching enzyme
VISFIRKGREPGDILVFICNFTPVVYDDYRLGVPFEAYYKELLNSDSESYGGSNVGNLGGVQADNMPHMQKPYSLKIRIPPLAMVVFKPELESTKQAV